MTAITFSNRLKRRRLERQLSQADLAAKAGISRTAISAIEGSRSVPSVAAALALAAALGCSVEDLFGPEKAAPQDEPTWALPPPATRCRYWLARVGERLLRYPVEFSDAGLMEHDGLFTESGIQARELGAPDQTLVMACCDPAVGLLVRQLARVAGVRLLVLTRSSREASALLNQGLVHLAGVHLSSTECPRGNAETVRAELGPGFSLLRLAHWQEGLALAPKLRLRSIRAALKAKLRWVGREPGSGARQCLDELLNGKAAPRRKAPNHRAVADSIRHGWADAGVCLRLTSDEAGLNFFKIREEIYDLCFRSADAADPRLEKLQATVRSPAYRGLLGDLPGYDSSATGELENLK